jgi:hypothetical protein
MYLSKENDKRSVGFIQKDSKRFLETKGWRYAQFLYDAASDTSNPYGSDSSFEKVCRQCHTLLKKETIFSDHTT